MNYYYADSNNQVIGPVTDEELKELNIKGIVTLDTNVIPEGEQDNNWHAYREIAPSNREVKNSVVESKFSKPNLPATPKNSNNPANMSNPQGIQYPQNTTATHIVVHQPYGGLVKASWILIIGTCALALVPFLGFASWLIAIPVFIVTFIFAIIIITRGGALAGVALLLTSILFGPLIVGTAPFISSFLGVAGAAAAAGVADSPLSNKISDRLQRTQRMQALMGEWVQDSKDRIYFMSGGRFSINGKEVPNNQWKLMEDELIFLKGSKSDTESIVSISETEFTTKESDGTTHTYKKPEHDER